MIIALGTLWELQCYEQRGRVWSPKELGIGKECRDELEDPGSFA